jgi:hypothetical protein
MLNGALKIARTHLALGCFNWQNTRYATNLLRDIRPRSGQVIRLESSSSLTVCVRNYELRIIVHFDWVTLRFEVPQAFGSAHHRAVTQGNNRHSTVQAFLKAMRWPAPLLAIATRSSHLRMDYFDGWAEAGLTF